MRSFGQARARYPVRRAKSTPWVNGPGGRIAAANKNGAEAPFKHRVIENHPPFDMRPAFIQGSVMATGDPSRALGLLLFYPMQSAFPVWRSMIEV